MKGPRASTLLLCSSVICLEFANVSGFGALLPSVGVLSKSSSSLRDTSTLSRSRGSASRTMGAGRSIQDLACTLEPVPTLKVLLSTRSTVSLCISPQYQKSVHRTCWSHSKARLTLFQDDEKEAIVREMNSLRQSSSEDLEKLLDGMLAEVERELPAWSSIALPFPLPSYRSKLGTVKRMLAALLDGEDLPRRRRSAIFQLAKQVGIVLQLKVYVCHIPFRQLHTLRIFCYLIINIWIQLIYLCPIVQLPSAKGVWGLEREVIRRTQKKLTVRTGQSCLQTSPKKMQVEQVTPNLGAAPKF